MLTLGQQLVLNGIAQQIVDRMRYELANKKIDRISIRRKNGFIERKNFSAVAKASGKSGNTLRYEVSENSIIVYGEDYLLNIVYGEAPTGQTSFTNKDSQLSGIRGWIDEKPLDVGDKNPNTVARLIQDKIASYGSSIWAKHNGKDSGVFADVLTDAIINEFNNKFTIQIENDLIEEFAA